MMLGTKLRFTVLLLLLITIIVGEWSCSKEMAEDGPTQIFLSNQSIYEKLPRNTILAELSTDVEDTGRRFTLVSGEGDDHNTEFEIKGNILRTRDVLSVDNGTTRSVRIRTSGRSSDFEAVATIEVMPFTGVYPTITSPSFQHNQQMPREFGADFGNVSPDLHIDDIPANTMSIMITMKDLDANGTLHWALWNIPPTKDRINKGESWPSGVVQGKNTYGEGYVGPFPPSEHRYEIAATFLTKNIDLTPSEYTSLTLATVGNMIAYTSIIGKYKP